MLNNIYYKSIVSPNPIYTHTNITNKQSHQNKCVKFNKNINIIYYNLSNEEKNMKLNHFNSINRYIHYQYIKDKFLQRYNIYISFDDFININNYDDDNIDINTNNDTDELQFYLEM